MSASPPIPSLQHVLCPGSSSSRLLRAYKTFGIQTNGVCWCLTRPIPLLRHSDPCSCICPTYRCAPSCLLLSSSLALGGSSVWLSRRHDLAVSIRQANELLFFFFCRRLDPIRSKNRRGVLCGSVWFGSVTTSKIRVCHFPHQASEQLGARAAGSLHDPHMTQTAAQGGHPQDKRTSCASFCRTHAPRSSSPSIPLSVIFISSRVLDLLSFLSFFWAMSTSLWLGSTAHSI